MGTFDHSKTYESPIESYNLNISGISQLYTFLYCQKKILSDFRYQLEDLDFSFLLSYIGQIMRRVFVRMMYSIKT